MAIFSNTIRNQSLHTQAFPRPYVQGTNKRQRHQPNRIGGEREEGREGERRVRKESPPTPDGGEEGEEEGEEEGRGG